MKAVSGVVVTIVVAASVVAASVTVSGQWLKHPTAGYRGSRTERRTWPRPRRERLTASPISPACGT